MVRGEWRTNRRNEMVQFFDRLALWAGGQFGWEANPGRCPGLEIGWAFDPACCPRPNGALDRPAQGNALGAAMPDSLAGPTGQPIVARRVTMWRMNRRLELWAR